MSTTIRWSAEYVAGDDEEYENLEKLLDARVGAEGNYSVTKRDPGTRTLGVAYDEQTATKAEVVDSAARSRL